jgi:hypothetical protein
MTARRLEEWKKYTAISTAIKIINTIEETEIKIFTNENEAVITGCHPIKLQRLKRINNAAVLPSMNLKHLKRILQNFKQHKR